MSVGEEYLVLEKPTPRQYSEVDTKDDKYLYLLDEVSVFPRAGAYPYTKYVFDKLICIVLLASLLPVILFFAVLIRMTSKGPAFYFQRRLGLNGRPYVMVKLRTMVHDAEAGTGAVWATSSDPRVTPLGLFLRKTQIDEFPQLVNVLLGQMSLIGPRPERPEISKRLESEIPHYSQRLHVRPGITGLAQLSLPADTDLQSVRRKLIPDLYYVKNLSFLLDLKIFMHTGIYFLRSLFKYTIQSFSLPTLDQARDSLVSELLDDFEVADAKRA